MKRKMLALVLALTICLSVLAACGGGGDSGPVKIGLLGPYTGAVAQYGLAVRDGAILYLEQYNEKGGINGREIEWVMYDDEHDPVKALTGYNYLVDQNVSAIIGAVTSAPTMAVVPEAFGDNMPMITASATAEGVTFNASNNQVYTNMFRSCFIDPFQGNRLADFAKNAIGATTAAVIFNTGVDYSVGLKDAFISKANEVGLEIVALEAYGTDAVDYQSQLTNIAAKNPDVLFVPDYYETVILLSQQAINAGVTATLLGADGWADVIGAISDPAPVNGSFFTAGFSVEDESPMVQDFLRAFTAKYNSEPSMFAAQGYDAAMILVAALEKAEAGSNTTATEAYRLDVIAALKATNMDCVTGNITYDNYNNPIKPAVIINIVNGEEKFWGKY